ncbi:MAG TPA: family 16 glycoside hydrolase [Blastocatellia bacterium]
MRSPVHFRIAATLLLALTLLYSACERVALDERFFDSSLPGWTAIDDPDTVQGPSDWKVQKDGWLHQTSNIWGRRGDFIGRWYGTYFVAGNTSWKNYHFSVDAKPGDNDGFGVVFRFRDPGHFYRLLLLDDRMSGGPLARLDKRNGPDYTQIWSSRYEYKVGQAIRIDVDLNGDTIRASIDGAQLVEAKDNSYPTGKIGLFCYAQQGQAFDDVKVTLQ